MKETIFKEATKIEENKVVKQITEETLKQYIFHPATVLVMLILDWGGLILEIPQTLAPILLIFTAFILFLIVAVISYNLQINLGADNKKDALIKAIIAGIICAIPYPIMTTGIGTIILTLSGFNALSSQGLPGLLEMFKKREVQV